MHSLLEAIVHDANGSILSEPVDWNISFDFNASEGNNSRVAELNATTGNYVGLNLYSTLRRHHGSVKEMKVIAGGIDYRAGEKVKLNSTNGFGFDGKIQKVVTEVFSVSGGQSISPYYRFTDSLGIDTNFSDIEFIPGHTYKFVADDINSSHPIMLGESAGDMNSSLVSGGPLTGSTGNIFVTFPSDFDGNLTYFCVNHSTTMNESVDVNATEIFLVSVKQTPSPFYEFNDSGGNEVDFSTYKLIGGKTYKFIATGDINTHPFMIGEGYGDLDSSHVLGGPLTDSTGSIIVTIPYGLDNALAYFCANHETMYKTFEIDSFSSYSFGEIYEVGVQNQGFDYLPDDLAEINSTNGVGAKIQPVFYDGYLTLEANSTVSGQPISSKVKVRASLRDILSSKEMWLDKYLDSILEQNATWWQKDAKITVNLPTGYEDDLYYFCTNHSGSMSGQFRIQQNINRIFVSGGQTTAPFYDFTDSDGNPVNFDEFNLIAGQTYVFIASDINASHPFKISDQNGTETLFSNEYITYSSGRMNWLG